MKIFLLAANRVSLQFLRYKSYESATFSEMADSGHFDFNTQLVSLDNFFSKVRGNFYARGGAFTS